MKNTYCKLSALSLIIACASEVNAQKHINSKVLPTNIVIILADDMGYSDIGCYGGEIKTPNIDKLASQGLRFTQFYNSARCCPTRASLLTGIYPHEAGMADMVVTGPEKSVPGPYQGYLNNQCVTIAEVLKKAGYYTAAVGKWHVGEERPHWPIDRGFDNYIGLISGAANYFDITRTKAPGVKRVFARDSTAYIPPEKGFYMTDFITNSAIDYLKIAKTKDQPFFLYLAYTAPHWPLQALQKDIEKYRGKFLKGWDILRKERLERMKQIGIINEDMILSDRDEEVQAWDSLSDEQKDEMDMLMAIYAAQIDRMDQGIGKVMNQLKDMGASENTLIFFLSDNGACHEGGIWGGDFWGNFWEGKAVPGSKDSYHSYGRSWANLSNTPFRMFKHWVHEGGISTPLIVKWPGKVQSKETITNQKGTVMDIMATCCDVANAKYPNEFEGHKIVPLRGKSLSPIFNGQERDDLGPIFWEHEGNAAVRTGDWKLVSKDSGGWELYNMSNDRTEMNDLTEQNEERSEKMLEIYKHWAISVGIK